MTTVPKGLHQRKQWIKGFERAYMLSLSTHPNWTRTELAIRERVLRIVQGKKRTKLAAKKK